MIATDLLEKIGQTLGSTASVRSVFGEPIQVNGKTIVPVARVAYGFGGGSGTRKNLAHTDQEGGGGGGGGGVGAYPAGALEVTQDVTRFVPFVDWQRFVGAFAAGLVFGALIAARRRT